MSGSGKGGKTKEATKTPTVRAGLHFPVSKVYRRMKGKYADRVTDRASVYVAAILEGLSAKILELAGSAAKDYKESRITLQYVVLVIKNDEELRRVFARILPSTQLPPFQMGLSTTGATTSRSQD